jgi:hypothetical protein
MQDGKHYYSYHILEKDTSFYQPSNENSDHHQNYHSQSFSPYRVQNQVEECKYPNNCIQRWSICY